MQNESGFNSSPELISITVPPEFLFEILPAWEQVRRQ